MVEIAWLPSFETGLPEIDNDHRKLVNSIRHIEVALKGGDFKKCATLFADFMQQAKDHFKREEAFLISIDFPRLESHRSAHQRLLDMADKTLATVSEDLDRDEATKCLEETIYFLLEDVIRADSDFKSYAQEHGLI
ncbi:MAG: hemerythrin family protein [Rhodospirillales bacterium]|nr:hemerythrin family protein [Rhodospirillales bacterium]